MLAGLCDDPAAWRWCSFKANAGLAPAPAFLDLTWREPFFGAEPAAASAAWRTHIAEQMARLDKLREFENALRRRAVLGSPGFRHRLEKGV